jgi:hypothetical protein
MPPGVKGFSFLGSAGFAGSAAEARTAKRGRVRRRRCIAIDRL